MDNVRSDLGRTNEITDIIKKKRLKRLGHVVQKDNAIDSRKSLKKKKTQRMTTSVIK